jgi:CubicO group peptidase (beta-lactamase class C family)
MERHRQPLILTTLAFLLAGPPAAAQAVPGPELVASPGVAPGADTTGPDHPVPPWAAETLRELELALGADVAADGVGSLVAAVVVGDRVVWEAAFGPADRETGGLAAPTTIYRVGSLTKPMTALVLLALAERGVVDLDGPVERYVPELVRLANRAPDHPPITFRHLASHTAGLAREPAGSHADRGPSRAWRRKVIAALPATEALAPPGHGYHYSNIGYAVLGLALERAARRPFHTLVRELVFEPLGMASSWFAVPRADRHRLAAGYVNPAPDIIDPRVPRAEHRGRGYRIPDAGAYSTAGDLALLVMAMTGARSLLPASPRALAAALADQTAGHGAAVTYGLGFQLHRVGDTLIAGHSGTTAGYTAAMAFDPATTIGIVLLRGYNRGATNLGATAVRAILELGERAPAPGDA